MSHRIDQLKKLLEADPNDTFCLYGLAQEYAKAGDHDRAVELYERTIEVDPGYCYAYYHMARSFEEQGQVERARETLQRGIEKAREAGDGKALGEIEDLLHDLS